MYLGPYGLPANPYNPIPLIALEMRLRNLLFIFFIVQLGWMGCATPPCTSHALEWKSASVYLNDAHVRMCAHVCACMRMYALLHSWGGSQQTWMASLYKSRSSPKTSANAYVGAAGFVLCELGCNKKFFCLGGISPPKILSGKGSKVHRLNLGEGVGGI